MCDCAAGGLDQLHRANGAGHAWWVGVVGLAYGMGVPLLLLGAGLDNVAEVGRMDDARGGRRRDDAGRRGVGGAAGLGKSGMRSPLRARRKPVR